MKASRQERNPARRDICRLLAAVLVCGLCMAGCGKEPPVSTEPSQPTEAETQQVTAPTDALPEGEDPEDPQMADGITGETGASVDMSEALSSGVKQTDEITIGIDVARYQGTIDWKKVADAGIDFAMVRVGYRTQVSGVITADSNARYNLQEAQKYGIKLGAYFFSTAVTEAEAVEEAAWVAEYISQYQITYPVAYNCEGFRDPENRQYGLSRQERTAIAAAFLDAMESYGYEAMFYASKGELEDQWETADLESDYKIWVAQYPAAPYPETEASSYAGVHHMWQYTNGGIVPGISGAVDVNVAYFGYEGTNDAKSDVTPEEAKADIEALVRFWDVSESVTAKSKTNLRDIPSQGAYSEVLYTLKNGEVAKRIGISDSGWSKLEFNGSIYYAVSSYLTTDLNYEPPTQPEDDGIATVFRSVNESVTAKEVVNLRTLPSVTNEDSKVAGQLKNGEVAKRIGISDNGWSKLEYNGSTYYAVSSYLTTDLDGSGGGESNNGEIQTQFRAVSEQVTAKDEVNLRTLPSVTDERSTVVATIKNGEVITRTGINTDVGWSRVVYNGQTLYCVSSYLETVE